MRQPRDHRLLLLFLLTPPFSPLPSPNMHPLFYQNKAVAVVGASRGIGLEWARQLAARGCTVSAGARTLTPELEALAAASGGRVTVSKVDVRSEGKRERERE